MKITNLIFILAIAYISISYENKVQPFTDRLSLLENDFSIQLRENQETEPSNDGQIQFSLNSNTVFIEEGKTSFTAKFLVEFPTRADAVNHTDKVLINGEYATCIFEQYKQKHLNIYLRYFQKTLEMDFREKFVFKLSLAVFFRKGDKQCLKHIKM